MMNWFRYEPMRPRVTPDPEQAAALERRRAELDYRPENGFLFERVQERVERDRSRPHG